MKTQQLQRTRQLQEDRRLFRFHTQAMVLVMAMTITMAMMLLLAWPSIAYAADQEDEDSGKTLAPYLWIEDEDVSVDSFPLKETRVSASINGVIAET